MENLNDKRQVYEFAELHESRVKDNPMEQFRLWFADADKHPDILEANAMLLSTVDEDACPSTRAMLLKSYDAEGFVFYTNYNSKKGKSLDRNKKVCLYFFWPALERQVIIKANVERVDESISDEYFRVRPRGSQLGALASSQSQNIPNREFLQDKLKDLEKEYEEKEIIRPAHWGGYIAKPYEIEFWQGRPNRLHDRLIYQLQNNNWKISRLAP